MLGVRSFIDLSVHPPQLAAKVHYTHSRRDAQEVIFGLLVELAFNSPINDQIAFNLHFSHCVLHDSL